MTTLELEELVPLLRGAIANVAQAYKVFETYRDCYDERTTLGEQRIANSVARLGGAILHLQEIQRQIDELTQPRA